MSTMRSLLMAAGLSVALAASAQPGGGGALIDPNLAERASLLELPGVTAGVADAIIAARPVLTMLGLDQALSGLLAAEQRTELYRRMFRQLNLNGASREEILLIPDISQRMPREFAEYRPYTSMEQFRREIGKYVSADEVARLERYVFIPANLNTASRESLAQIPGMNDRMVREFLEYRPYTSIEQFRREIGKYVSAEEVARLESYVTLD